jgi:hypothetical protein
MTVPFNTFVAGVASATAPVGTELFPIIQGATSKNLTAQQMSYLTGVVCCEMYGASPSASGAVNTAAINTALAVGGNVTLMVPGTYTIAASSTLVRASGNTNALCLVIGTGTSFTLGEGVIVQVAAGLTNPIAIQNSNVTGGNSNISINGPGVIDGNYPNVTRSDAGTDFCCILIWMQNVTTIYMNNLRVHNSTAWRVGFGGCSKIFINNFKSFDTTPHVNGDGLHFHGPNTDIQIRGVYGNNGDDIVAFTCATSTLYNATLAGNGSMSDILVDGIISDPVAGCSELLRLQDDTTNTMSRFTGVNLIGPYGVASTTGGSAAFTILSSNFSASTMNDIALKNIHCSPLTGTNPAGATLTLGTNIASITIDGITRYYKDGSETTKEPVISIGGTTTSIKVKNITVYDQTAAGAGVSFISVTGIANSLQIDGISIPNTVTSNNFIGISGTGNVQRLLVNQADTSHLSNFISYTGSVGCSFTTKINNGWFRNVLNVIGTNGFTGTLPLLQLCNIDTTGNLANFNGLTGQCLIETNACVAGSTISRAGTENIRIQTIEVPIIIGILTPSAGDIVLDQTTSSLVTYDGTAWFFDQKVTRALGFAATVTPVMVPGTTNGGNIFNVGTLTGAITVANPATIPPSGTSVVFNFLQDATGVRAVSWGAGYKFPVAWSNVGNTANTRSSMTFVSDGTNLWAQGQNTWA